jgi:predicted amidohydrolase
MEDIKMTSVYNNVYTAVCNNAVSAGNPGFVEDAGSSGGTSIFGPQGEVLAAANSEHETIVTTTVPIEDFRNRRRLPQVHMDLYRPVFDAYRNRYPPNLFLSYLPTDGRDSARYLKDKAVWIK